MRNLRTGTSIEDQGQQLYFWRLMRTQIRELTAGFSGAIFVKMYGLKLTLTLQMTHSVLRYGSADVGALLIRQNQSSAVANSVILRHSK
jgi:hypothetical protein